MTGDKDHRMMVEVVIQTKKKNMEMKNEKRSKVNSAHGSKLQPFHFN